MRRVPWHLAARFGRKAALTMAAVSLSVAFCLSSFSVARALEGDILGLAKNHPGLVAIAAHPEGAPFAFRDEWGEQGAFGVAVGEGEIDGRSAPVLAFIGAKAAPSGSTAFGTATDRPLVIGGVVLDVQPLPAADPWVPPGWFVVPADTLRPAGVDYVVIDLALAEDFAAQGLVVTHAPALRSFFTSSGVEISNDLALVVAFGSLLAALFSYELLRSEVRERRHEIGIWRAIGMRRSDVLAIFVLRGAIIGGAAFGIGLALTVALTRAAASRLVLDTRAIQPSMSVFVATALVFMLACAAGGLLPALQASRIEVQTALEARG